MDSRPGDAGRKLAALYVHRLNPGRSRRIFGLLGGLCWGAAVAWVQLRLTWELTAISGFARPPAMLRDFSFPVAQCGQFALPEVYLGRPGSTEDAYWTKRGAAQANRSRTSVSFRLYLRS